MKEGLRATLPVTVRTPSVFAVEARLARDGETVAYAGYQREMDPETDLLAVDFPLAAPPPQGRYEIAIALHWYVPVLQPVSSLLVEDVELPPAP